MDLMLEYCYKHVFSRVGLEVEPSARAEVAGNLFS